MPEELAGLPQTLISHSSAHASFEPFRDKDVIVLGGGQSALECSGVAQRGRRAPHLGGAPRQHRMGQSDR